MKLSMFNVFCNAGEDILIFNTYKGPSSIMRVSKKNKDTVLQILNGNLDLVNKLEKHTLDMLEEYGFLLNDDVDEILRRKVLYAEFLMSGNLNLVIHTTKNCNFRCNYCGIDFNNQNLSEDMQHSIITYVTKNINKFSGVHISWFGGEPLMNMSAIEYMSKKLIQLCEKARKPYSSSITTNGYLLTPKNINVLIRCRVTSFTVTIDGIGETHDQMRVLSNGMGTFEKIIGNLEYIRDNVKTRALKVIIRSNLTKSMTDPNYLKKYYLYYDRKFGVDDRFGLFIRPVCDWGGERVSKLKDNLLETNNEDMASTYEYLASIINCIKFDKNMIDLYNGGLTCSGKRKNKYTITVDGWVAKCDDADINKSVGNINFNGMVLDDDKSMNWMINKKVENKCLECPLSCICFMDGCPSARLRNGEATCALNLREVKGLMKLFASSYEVRSI